MSCVLTSGRTEPCKDKVGGLKAVYFINFEPLGVTYDTTHTDLITDLVDADGTTEPTAYKYELRGANSFDQTIVASRDNGTAFFEQTLNLTLKGLTKEMHKELKLLAYGRPHVIVEDNNGSLFLMGLEHGAEVTGGTIVSGTAMGDLYGYTLTLMSQEKVPANFIQGTIDNIVTVA